MKVLLVNGSSHAHGCTYTALSEVARTLGEAGVETEIIQTGSAPVSDCIACGQCEAACPQHIEIIEELKKAVEMFEG